MIRLQLVCDGPDCEAVFPETGKPLCPMPARSLLGAWELRELAGAAGWRRAPVPSLDDLCPKCVKKAKARNRDAAMVAASNAFPFAEDSSDAD